MQFSRLVFASLLLLASGTYGQELLTSDQLKTLETEKKWNELVGATTRILSLKGEKAKEYDRVETLVFKAEAQLQLKQFSLAASTYELISKEPTASDEQIDKSLAMALLSRKVDAKGYRVVAKGQPPTVIDIYNPENRKEAFQAMFDSASGDLKKEVDKNRTTPNLTALAKVVRTASDLKHVERAASGKDEQSQEMLKTIDEMAVRSIKTWVEDSNQQVEQIQQRAEERTTRIDPVTHREITRRRGLEGTDRQVLDKIISECKGSVTSYKQLVEAFKEPSASLKDLPSEIQRLHDKAANLKSLN